VLEPSCFLNVIWHGEAFYGLGIQGFGVLFLLFVFCFVLFLLSVAPAGKYSDWSAEGFPSTFEASRIAGSRLVGLWADRQVAAWPSLQF
jgi:hypothetical protein